MRFLLGTGIIGPDREDPRDKIKVTWEAEPGYSKLRPAEVRNQGSTNRSVGFACAYAVSLLIAKINKPSAVSLSANWIYYHARNRKSIDDGAYLRDAFKAMNKEGAIAESRWKDNEDFYKIGPYRNVGQRFYVRSYARVTTLKDIKRVLYFEEMPLVMGVLIYETVAKDAGYTGIMALPRASDTVIGYHAMTCYGVCLHNSQEYFHMQNSWGRDWGNKGNCLIPVNYLEECFISDVWTFDQNY